MQDFCALSTENRGFKAIISRSLQKNSREIPKNLTNKPRIKRDLEGVKNLWNFTKISFSLTFQNHKIYIPQGLDHPLSLLT